MPAFCDVALPVPLDQTFTYAVNGAAAGGGPVVGARVLVPFSGQRLMGVVVRVHDDAPADGFEIKPVQQVLDDTAVLPDELMELARWIAAYYVAPLGEVLGDVAAGCGGEAAFFLQDCGGRAAGVV